MKKLMFNFVFVLLALSTSIYAQNDKMDWWREARFGMFIHWGVYSVYGNVYNGFDVNGEPVSYDARSSSNPSEWIMNLVKIPRAVYREAAKQFDAKDYDPKEWVQIAKNAGMKYIVITAKHHDGFCLFETAYTDWNAIDASAAQRDLLKDLVKEAHNAGLKIGFYYSQNLDWMAEGGMGNVPELNEKEYQMDKVTNYVNNLVIPQIQELTTHYDIDVFWFDYPSVNNSNNAISQSILNALMNSPVGNKIIVNDRLFPGFNGDFMTAESDTPHVPYNGFADGRDWEACASLNNTWGYEFPMETVWAYGHWKTELYTISRILELSSKGGNFLLNVGPDQHGNIPDSAILVLSKVGEWMKIYGDAIYGTQKNELVNPFEYGYVTQKKENDGSVHWYLHVSPAFWPEKEIVLPGVTDLPHSAIAFETKAPLEMKLRDENLIISLPDSCPNPYYATLDLYFTKPPKQIAKSPIRNNIIRLTPFQAVTDFLLKKDFSPYAYKFWFYKKDAIEFDVYLDKGQYTLETEYAAWMDGGELYFNFNDTRYIGYYKGTGDKNKYDDFSNFIIDNFNDMKINIPESKTYHIRITRSAELPNITNWIYVRNFTLKKVSNTDSSFVANPIIYPTFVKDGYLICNQPVEEEIRIFDFAGRLLKTHILGLDKRIEIDLPSGVYIVRGGHFSQRIIVRK
ncbi:hypothetical protein FACS1894160_2330 [Bacteroidia bacterium]|nr:hypothetical protein FACS1894160_2330 [Bacteroidia bacterium]